MFLGQCKPFLSRDLPLWIEIALGGHDNLADFERGIVFNLIHPFFYILEGDSICDGEGEYDACRSLVVGLGDVLEAFLASSVPDLQFVLLVLEVDGLDLEVDPDRGHVGLLEVVFA